MAAPRVIIVGGGAAGFFAAITCAEANLRAQVTILEKTPRFLSKVKISGGGRCNVTHAPDKPRPFAANYPRGERALRQALAAFDSADAIAWFARRGVEMYTQDDGCLFPVSDDSQTVVDCLLNAAANAGVSLVPDAAPEKIVRAGEGFEVVLADGKALACDRVLLATGGCRTAVMGALAVSLGHRLETPVPSLFTFHVDLPWVHELAGIVVEDIEATAAGLRERGILLFTHWGFSGPAILRLSAWGARRLAALDYRFELRVNWLPEMGFDEISAELDRRRETTPAKLVANLPLAPLQARLWKALVATAGVAPGCRWSELSRAARHRLAGQLARTDFAVVGKSMNKDEFVTCGGVPLDEVDMKTMESRLCPGLYFAGELLDIDGLTGGYNFQGCWTTGFLAGRAMAALPG